MQGRALRLLWSIASASALALVALSAAAQGREGRAGGGIARVCAAEAARLCPGARGAELLLCLDGHRAELGAECRARVTRSSARVRERHALVEQACKDDAARLCPGVEAGPGQGLLRCLGRHEAELSEPCRVQLPPHEPR